MHRFFWILLLLVQLAASAAEKKLRIVTTFLPGYSFAANVAGDLATVENLVPGSVSLHDYQLSPAELRKLSAADLIIVNGLGMETFLDRVLKNLGPGAARKVVYLSNGLEPRLIRDADHDHGHDEDHGHHHGATNPHIWLDPELASHSVTNILTALSSADPRNAAAYRQNATRYIETLKKLDAELAAQLAPVRSAPFITYHSAFPYFARRYQLKLVDVVEETPEVAASPRHLAALYGTIREKRVMALFTAPQERPRMAAQIVRDTGIKLAELDPLEMGVLTADSYEEGMRRNARALLETLR